MRSAAKPPRLSTAHARAGHLFAVLIGTYGFVWAATGFGAVALLRLGWERSEAVILCTLLGYLLYPAVALSLFAARRPLRAFGLVAGISVALLLAHLMVDG